MARITVEDCLEQENNRFALVQLAAKRTKQILGGAKALVASSNKAVVTALREIADSKVRFMTEDEIVLAREQEALESQQEMSHQNTTVIAAVAPNIEQLLASSDDDDDIDDEEIPDDEEDDDDDDTSKLEVSAESEPKEEFESKEESESEKEPLPTDPERNGNHE